MRHCVQELLELGPVFVIFRIVQLCFGQFDPLHQRITAQLIDRYGTFRQQSQPFRCDIGKATENDIFAGFSGSELHRYDTWLDHRHRRRMVGHDGHLTFGRRNDNLAYLFRDQQPLGETNSKLKLSAMAFYFLTLETERTVINRAFFDPWIRQQQLPTSLPFRWLRPLSRPCRRRLPAYGRSHH